MALLRHDWHGDVVVLRWDDHENRMNLDSLREWHETLAELEAREGPLAVVVTGTGKFFSNGLDLDRFGTHPEEAGEIVRLVEQLFGRLVLLPAYVVAAVNGHAFAGGAMLSCAADVRVMRRDRGYWCLPEVDLGLPLTEAMHAIVTARLPRAAAFDAIITGRRFSAEDALSAGIVEHVADEAAVVERAIALAAPMAAKDRTVIAVHKRQLFGATAAVCGWPPPA